MKYINTYTFNGADTVVSATDSGIDIGIISKFKARYCFYPFSVGKYITENELKDIIKLLGVLNKSATVIPALLKKDSSAPS